MGKNNKGIIGTLLMLLLLIPLSYGVYYGVNYLLKDTETSDTTQEQIEGLAIFIAGEKIAVINSKDVYEYTYFLPNIGDEVDVDFMKNGTDQYHENNVKYNLNDDAKQSLEIKDAFQTNTFHKTRIRLKQVTNTARITFTDDKDTFYFRLFIISEIVIAENITFTDVIFYQ